MKIKCKICNKEIAKNFFSKHIKEEHNIEKIELYAIDILKVNNKCLVCGKQTSFLNLNKGFREFCSNSCSAKYNANREDVKAKRIETNNNRYGGHPAKNIIVKEKQRKKLESLKTDDNYQIEINKKRTTTCLEKYNVKFPSQTKIYKETLLNNLKHKYEELTNSKFIEKIDKDYYRLKCNKCLSEFIIHRHLIMQRNSKDICVCIECIKKRSYSHPEISLYNFIVDNYKGEIIKNNRTILDGKELDIYLPELNIAFEFNGLYWHSELYRDKNYHLNKTNTCELNDVHLIQIYEDDWNLKNDIIKSRILNLLGESERIFARKCIIKEVSSKEYKNFLLSNHIQGNVNSKNSYGLYYNDELVSLMTFGINRFRKDKNIELLRFCNKLNTTVVGGASRLFKYALKVNKWNKVISYADRSWSIGILYKNLGFSLESKTPPNYFYIINSKRENRFKYRKSELVKQGFLVNMSEHEIMFKRGLYRIYDSGSLTYIYTNKEEE